MRAMSPAAVLLPSRREYWDQRLDGAGDIGLATDWRRDPMYARCVADERITVRLDPYLTGAGIDAFATMLAAWYAVLHRHTNQADLLVGTRYRHCPGESEVTSVVPLRTVFDPAGPFEALVAGSRETVAAAFLHSDTATGPYITELLAAHGLSMRVGFAVLREGPHYREGQEQIQEFDIELIAEDVDGQTTIHLSYDASLYSRPTAVRLLSHFTTALSEGIRAPQSPVRRLRVESEPASPPAWPLAAPEGWIPAAITQESLVDRFRSVVAAHSDRVAVSGVSGEYRYAELDRVSTAMAGRLDQLPGLGLPVALLCDHDIGLAVGIWSILKTGRGYVPLDPRQPDSRLARTIADAQVAALLCDVALAERAALLAGGRPVVTLDTGVPAAGDGSLAAVPADSVAYLLHTSGTTGGPKAVMQSHANVLAHSLTYANRTRIVPADRIPLLARFTFDLAVMDFFGALLTGASIQIIDPIRPASELWDKLAEARASILHCTPTLYRHLLAGAAEGRESRPCRVAVPDTFRLVVLGGEKVTRDDLQAFFRHFPGRCAMVSGLSATECSVALQHQARHADLLASSVPVGHAVEGIQVRLVDEDGWPTEVFGELEILSDRVALGYWNMPSATAAVFGEHPGRTRFYRTGDLARRLPDGALVHCGRKDRQVKIRGHRVEPGEIESLLRVHPSVAQAAVLLDQCASRPQLLAYVTSTTSVPVSTGELIEHLRRQLPDYMVPSRVRWLDVMPVGPTGKLDYSRLPLPEDEIASVADVPRSGLERAVATIWCQVLGLAEIGVRANFMAAGGDSIQLKTMLARLKEEFEADISLIDFLRSPTVGATAELIQRNGRPGVILAPARYLES